MKFLINLKLIVIGLISFLVLIAITHPLTAFSINPDNSNTDPPNLEQLYQPRAFSIAFTPNIQEIEKASNVTRNIPSSQTLSFLIPSPNPRDNLAIEGSIDHAQQTAIPITSNQINGMFEREAAINARNSIGGFTPQQKQNSVILASMDLDNLAQYESCVYVDAYGDAKDGCFLDLFVRDLNSGREWIYPRVSIDRFCVIVVKSILNRTWF